MSNQTLTANGQSDASITQSLWVNRLEGMPGVALAFLWGLAEGTFFFILPDVAISLLALLKPRHVWRQILAATAGSVVAGMLLFNWSCSNPRGAHEAVAKVPFVTAKMFERVHASYRMHGLGAVFLGPLLGTPYKIYAVEAPEFLSRAAFLGARFRREQSDFCSFGPHSALLELCFADFTNGQSRNWPSCMDLSGQLCMPAIGASLFFDENACRGASGIWRVFTI